MLMRIHPRQVEAFRAVMITGAFSAAAQTMHITQPAVSRLIRDFEIEIGLTLFEREGNRILPREEAIILYREVEQLYVGLEQIGRVAHDIRAVRGGVLRIGSVTSLNELCVSGALPAFARRFPGVTVIFDTESTERVFDLVAIRHYDLGFVYGGGERGNLPREDLATADAVAVVALDHPLADREAVELAELADYRMILPGRRSPLRILLDQEFRRAAITPRTPIEASLVNCCTLAEGGLGVAVVDPLVARSFGARLATCALRPRLTLSYQIIRPPQAPQSQLTIAFTNELKAAAKDTWKNDPA